MSRVEESDPEGLDYGWVMQVTFVLTVLVGAPLVAALSVTRPLPTWEARATFAVRVGAVVWILTALSVYLYARRERPGEGPDPDAGSGGDDPAPGDPPPEDGGGEGEDPPAEDQDADGEDPTGEADATPGEGDGDGARAGDREEGTPDRG